MNKQQALIHWIDSVVGGRKVVPIDPSYDGKTHNFYCVPAKFQGWGHEAWSMYVQVLALYDDHPGVYRAMIWFLADNAPVEVFKPGMQFALYEGTRIVAVGRCT